MNDTFRETVIIVLIVAGLLLVAKAGGHKSGPTIHEDRIDACMQAFSDGKVAGELRLLTDSMARAEYCRRVTTTY